MTQTQTLRDTARQLVAEEVGEAAKLGHHMNYHKLHVRRDGSVSWTESINKSDDIIDSGAERFAPVPSVACVGTGGYACNCDHCEDVYSEIDEQNAKDAGREYDRDNKYASQAEAIADSVSEGLGDIEAEMLEAFDAIPAGYFDDEE